MAYDTPNSSLTASPDSWPEPEVFGQYRIAGVIDRGGMAELLLAIREVDKTFRQVVALKRVLPQMTEVEGFSGLFQEEARIMGRLEHPNIVRVFDFGQINGVFYLAMEYLAGEDLGHIIERLNANNERVPARLAAAIARDIAGALAYAHDFTNDFGQSLELLHRDVSPSNVILTFQGVTKLIDFGIAKTRERVDHAQVGTIKGKLSYVAPEVIAQKKTDGRIDIYSLGCVLWEMVTGAPPFADDDDAKLVNTILSGRLPDLRAVVPDVDESLAAIVMRAMALDPAQRFANAAELEEALEAYLEETGGQLGHHQVARWLVALVGAEDATAQQDVASGNRLQLALPKVMASMNKRPPVKRDAQALRAEAASDSKALAPTWLMVVLALTVAVLTTMSVAASTLSETGLTTRLKIDRGESTVVLIDGAKVTPDANSTLTVSRGLHVVQWLRNGQLLSTRTLDVRGAEAEAAPLKQAL